jgi:hypothetical protein
LLVHFFRDPFFKFPLGVVTVGSMEREFALGAVVESRKTLVVSAEAVILRESE